MTSVNNLLGYDRLKEVKQFDESKIGVKGLVDSGATTIPRFFHQPPENLPGLKPKNRPQLAVPVIDLSGDRSTIIEEIRRSSSTLGFFQIVNHSISTAQIDSVINAVKDFFEQSTEYKMKFYHREVGKGAAYSTNFDLYQSKAATWRDTLQVRTSPVGLTILVQNEVGGLLQVKTGQDWADVDVVPGAIVINIGDLLQIMSNDEYKSVEHRVLANPVEGARVSIAAFFTASKREKLYGPFPELTSAQKPAGYQEFILEDYMKRFFTNGLDGKTLTDFYKIDNIKG